MPEKENKSQDLKEQTKKHFMKRDNNEKTSKKEESKNENKENQVVLTQEEFNSIKMQVAKAMNDYKELENDFDNYRKRMSENISSAKLEGTKMALETVLPALDSFKKARSLVSDKASLDGINLIEKNIFATLEKLGVKKIESIGKPFDPNLHNAILMVEDKTKKSGTVIEEMEMGYKLGDTILKYSQVVVAK